MIERFNSSVESNKNNAFEMPIFEIKDVLQDPEIENVIQSMRRDVFKSLGIDDAKSDMVMDQCLKFAKNYDDINEYEQAAHNILESEGVVDAIPEKLIERAEIIHEQIKKYLKDGLVLDFGCGDARLAQLIAKDGNEVQLADVYENPNVAKTGLPFELLEQGKDIPFEDNKFDNTLLLTVFHHSDDPIQLMKETKRVTKPGGRVIVIESVYDVDGKELSEDERKKSEEYLALSPEQQRRVNIFFDHFYNRVIHNSDDPSKKVNVPFNFNTPEEWKKLFDEQDLKQEEVVHLGPDQPTVPEYHTLHVLKK